MQHADQQIIKAIALIKRFPTLEHYETYLDQLSLSSFSLLSPEHRYMRVEHWQECKSICDIALKNGYTW